MLEKTWPEFEKTKTLRTGSRGCIAWVARNMCPVSLAVMLAFLFASPGVSQVRHFAVIGDQHGECGTTVDDTFNGMFTYACQRETAVWQAIMARNPDFVLGLGDHASPRGSVSQKTQFFSTITANITQAMVGSSGAWITVPLAAADLDLPHTRGMVCVNGATNCLSGGSTGATPGGLVGPKFLGQYGWQACTPGSNVWCQTQDGTHYYQACSPGDGCAAGVGTKTDMRTFKAFLGEGLSNGEFVECGDGNRYAQHIFGPNPTVQCFVTKPHNTGETFRVSEQGPWAGQIAVRNNNWSATSIMVPGVIPFVSPMGNHDFDSGAWEAEFGQVDANVAINQYYAPPYPLTNTGNNTFANAIVGGAFTTYDGYGADYTPVITNGQVTGYTQNATGTDYACSGLQAYVIGDGSGAVATPVCASGSITSVTPTATGSGYTHAVIRFHTPANGGGDRGMQYLWPHDYPAVNYAGHQAIMSYFHLYDAATNPMLQVIAVESDGRSVWGTNCTKYTSGVCTDNKNPQSRDTSAWLNTSTMPLNILIQHHPLYSTPVTGSSGTQEFSNFNMRNWQPLGRKLTAFFVGHEHHYMRTHAPTAEACQADTSGNCTNLTPSSAPCTNQPGMRPSRSDPHPCFDEIIIAMSGGGGGDGAVVPAAVEPWSAVLPNYPGYDITHFGYGWVTYGVTSQIPQCVAANVQTGHCMYLEYHQVCTTFDKTCYETWGATGRSYSIAPTDTLYDSLAIAGQDPLVTVTPTGYGVVTSNDGNLNCGNGGTACSEGVLMDSSLTLTASGSGTFLGWSGCPAPAGNSCSMTIDNTAVNVTANFGPNPTLTLMTNSLAGGVQSVTYSALLQASGGSQSYTWSIVSGTLPPGMTLNAQTGALTGTPTSNGSYSFVVQVSDSKGNAATANLTLTVAASPLDSSGSVQSSGTVVSH